MLHRSFRSCFPFLLNSIRKIHVMKIDSPLFVQSLSPDVLKLKEVFDKYSFELRIAGGAVRDILVGKVPNDIDFATDATPTQMLEMFEKESIRVLKFGVRAAEHGTCPVRINDRTNFEVTTLRIDEETDGRHAKVTFTTDWTLDASRRDLTINSMFLSLDGTLYDYFGGQEDIKKQKIQFVGDPSKRMREDYLRILRFFRFHDKIHADPEQHGEDILNIIREQAPNLTGVAGERIWMELKKIFAGPLAEPLLRKMVQVGVTPYIGLPDNPDLCEFARVCHRSQELSPHYMTRAAALLKDVDELNQLNDRVKMSREELLLTTAVIEERENPLFNIATTTTEHTAETDKDVSPSGIPTNQTPADSHMVGDTSNQTPADSHMVGDTSNQASADSHMMEGDASNQASVLSTDAALRAIQLWIVSVREVNPYTRRKRKVLTQTQRHLYSIELLKYVGHGSMARSIEVWTAPKLPITGLHLQSLGFKKGPLIGESIDRLRTAWIESEFKLSEDCLIEKAKVLLQEQQLAKAAGKKRKSSSSSPSGDKVS